MERGTDRERAAVRARWAAFEWQERRARRLLVATALLAAAPIPMLLVAAVPTEACIAAAGTRPCRSLALTRPGVVTLIFLAAIAAAAGGWLCVSALLDRA